MRPLDAGVLRAIMPRAGRYADVYAPHLAATCARFDIATPARMAFFLANVAVESTELTHVVEDTYYRDPARLLSLFPHDFKDLADARAVQAKGAQAIANRIYANQNGNGPESSGDGWNYRGRSLAQITGRHGYTVIGFNLELDLLNHPELLEAPEYAAAAAGQFWHNENLNRYADAGNFLAVCGVWNVGNPRASSRAINGYAERANFRATADKILNSTL